MGTIYLVRHGQASFGAANYDQLTDRGHAQGRALGDALRTRLPRVDRVVTGTMKRHHETAAACLEALALESERVSVPGFDEFDHEVVIARYEPRYEDKVQLALDIAKTPSPGRAFQAIFEQAVARWTSGHHDTEYPESFPAFRARCAAALNELVRELGASKTALVFTSGGPIASIAADLLGVPDSRSLAIQWNLANCGVTKLLYGRSGISLLTLNDHGHFEGADAPLLTFR